MERINRLCSFLDRCATFADVACDHGYCAEYMLGNGLCDFAYVTDISDKCLSKARALLSGYISSGKCRAVRCDGLQGLDKEISQVLIAGLGGEEIIRILKNSFIPRKFVFQPMKNADLLRVYLLESGCKITADDVFSDGKNYYFIVKGESLGAVDCKRAETDVKTNSESYNKAEILYGKDSLKNPVFYDYIGAEIAKKKSYLTREMKRGNREKLQAEIAFMQEVADGVYR